MPPEIFPQTESAVAPPAPTPASPRIMDRHLLRAAQPLPSSRPSLEPFQPRPPKPTLLESLYAGTAMTNFIVAGGEAIFRETAESSTPDPNFKPGEFLLQDPENSWMLDLSVRDEDVFDSLANVQNQQEMEALLANTKRALDQGAAFMEHPAAGVIGAVGGALLDLPLLLVPGGGAGLFIGGAAKAVQTLKAARGLAALRLGAIGAVENLAFEELQALRDPTVGVEEFLWAGGAGALIGGGLGAAFPRKFGGLVLKSDIAEMAAARQAAGPKQPFNRGQVSDAPDVPRSAGAQAVPPDLANPDLPFGGGSIGRSVLPLEGLRSIKQRRLNELADNVDDPAERAFFEKFQKLVRFETVTVGERAGRTIRGADNWEEATRKYMGAEWLSGLHSKWQITYTSLAKDLESDLMARKIRAPMFGGTFLFGLIKRYPKSGIDKGEFEKLIWWYSQHEGRGLGGDNALKHWLPDDISEADFARVRKAVKESTAHTDELMNRAWAKWHEEGLVESPEPPFQNYWPQIWKRDDIAAAERDATDFLVFNQGWDPPEPWLVEQGFLQPGQFAHNMSDVDKSLARDAWAARNATKIEADAERLLKEARANLQAAQDEAIEAAFMRSDRKLARIEERITRWEDRFDNAKSNTARNQATDNIAKAEAERNDLIAKVEEARARMSGAEEILAELGAAKKRTRSRAERAAIVKAEKKLVKAEKKVTRAETRAAAPLREIDVDPEARAKKMLGNINSTLTDKLSVFGFAMANYDVGKAGQASRSFPREIDLARSIAQFDPRLDKFLDNDPQSLLSGYFQHMAPRAALQETFGTQDLEEVFRPLIEALPAPRRREASADVKAVLDFGLQRHLMADPDMRFWSQIFRNFNVPAFLPRGIISQIGDASITHSSLGSRNIGTTLGRSVRQFFGTDKQVRTAMEAMDKPQLMALILGLEQTAAMNQRARRLLQLDPALARHGSGRPGSTWWHLSRKLMKGSETAAKGMMTLNFMGHWNRAQSRGVRKAAIMQLVTEDFDKLPANYQGVMRSRGIGPEDMARFKKLYEEHSVELAPGLRFPDVDNWPASARVKLERAIEVADGRAIIMPTLGDMPRWASTPLGAIFFQFTGFAYSSQSKFVRVLMQDPTAASHMQSLFLAMFLTVVAQGARAVLSSKTDDFVESWQSPEGVSQNLYEMYTRGPFAVAWSTAAADLAVGMTGRAGNQALQKIGLPSLLPQPSRFAERDLMSRTMGPSYTMGQRMMRMGAEGGAALTGGAEEQDQFWRTAKRYAPGAGLTQLYGLDALLGDEDR